MTTPAEKVVAAQHTELRQHASKSLELRKQLEKVSKELAICKQQLHTSQQALHASQNNVQTHQEYSRKLEGLLEHSGKGIALVKSAKLQAELEFFQEENALLFSELQTKSKEAESLQHALDHHKGLVDEAARNAGFSNRAMLEEIVELKTQAASLSDTLLEKEALVKRLETELQEAQQYRHKHQSSEAHILQLLSAAEAAEADKVALLEYIEEMQNARELEQATQAAAQQQQSQVVEMQNQMSNLQAVMSDQQQLLQACQQQCRDAESAVEIERGINMKLRQQLGQLKAQQSVVPGHDALIAQELQRMQEALQAVLANNGNQAKSNDHSSANQQQQRLQVLTSPAQDNNHTTSSPCSSPSPLLLQHGTGGNMQAQVVHRLSYIAKQQQQLISQHKALQDAWEQADTNNHELAQIKSKLCSLESCHAACGGQIQQMTCQIDNHNMHWKALAAVIKETASQAMAARVGVETAPELSAASLITHVCGREHEVVNRVGDFSKLLLLQLCETAAARNSIEADVHDMTSKLQTECNRSQQYDSELVATKAHCQQLLQQLSTTQTELQNTRKAQQGSAAESAGLLGKVAELQAKLDANTAEMENLMAAQEQQHHQAEELGQQLQQALSDKEEAMMKLQALQQVIVEEEEELLQRKGTHVSPIPMKSWTPCIGNPAGSPARHPPIALRAPQPQLQLNPVHLQLAQVQLQQRQQRLQHEQQRHAHKLENSLFQKRTELQAKAVISETVVCRSEEGQKRCKTAERVRIGAEPQSPRNETARQRQLPRSDSSSDSDTSSIQNPGSPRMQIQTGKAVWDTVSKQKTNVKGSNAGKTPRTASRPSRMPTSPQMPGSRLQGKAQRKDGKLLVATSSNDQGSAKAVIDKLSMLTASYNNLRRVVQ